MAMRYAKITRGRHKCCGNLTLRESAFRENVLTHSLRSRRTHQRRQAPTRPRPLPLQGYVGINRWVGLGVIADNVVNIGRAMKAGGP